MYKYIVRLPSGQYATLETKEDLMPNRIVDITVDGEDVRAVVLQKGYRSLLKDPFIILDGQIRAIPSDEFDEPHMRKVYEP